MIKYYCENQPITNNCASDIIEIKSGENITSIIMQVTKNFDNLDILNVYFQASQDEDFANHTELVKQTFFKEHLKKGMRSEIKFVPINFQKYSRLYFEIIGEKPTAGKITAVLYQERKEDE